MFVRYFSVLFLLYIIAFASMSAKADMCLDRFVVKDLSFQTRSFQYTEFGTFYADPDTTQTLNQDLSIKQLSSLCSENFGHDFLFRPQVEIDSQKKKKGFFDSAMKALQINLPGLSEKTHSVTMLQKRTDSIVYSCSKRLPEGANCQSSELQRRPAAVGMQNSIASLAFGNISGLIQVPTRSMGD
jgi:hypothetical protein